MTTAHDAESMVAALVAHYRASAKRHGEATENGDHKEANIAAVQIASAYRELRQHGRKAQREILRLMSDPDPGVRLWSASHALEFSQPEAQVELTKLAKQKSLLGLSAEMTLKEWRAGRLRFQ